MRSSPDGSSSSGSLIDSGGNDSLSELSPNRSRTPSIIIRTGGTVHRHKIRDLPWGIRLLQKLTEWWCPTYVVNRDTW